MLTWSPASMSSSRPSSTSRPGPAQWSFLSAASARATGRRSALSSAPCTWGPSSGHASSFCARCYDEDMVAMEDTDLGLRAGTRARVGRPSNMLLHDEGALTVLAVCRKKAAYATWVAAFRSKHGSGALLAQSALGMGVLAFERRRATGCRIRPARQGFEARAQRHCGPGSAQVTAQVRLAGAPDLFASAYPAAIRSCMSDRFILTSNIGKRILSNGSVLHAEAKGG